MIQCTCGEKFERSGSKAWREHCRANKGHRYKVEVWYKDLTPEQKKQLEPFGAIVFAKQEILAIERRYKRPAVEIDVATDKVYSVFAGYL